MLAIYNHDLLRQRLTQPSTPVTYVGKSLATELSTATAAATPVDDSKGAAATSKSVPKTVSPDVSFVIDIEISPSATVEEVIVGLRVDLATTGVKEDQRPRFLSVSFIHLQNMCIWLSAFPTLWSAQYIDRGTHSMTWLTFG